MVDPRSGVTPRTGTGGRGRRSVRGCMVILRGISTQCICSFSVNLPILCHGSEHGTSCKNRSLIGIIIEIGSIPVEWINSPVLRWFYAEKHSLYLSPSLLRVKSFYHATEVLKNIILVSHMAGLVNYAVDLFDFPSCTPNTCTLDRSHL